MKSAKIRDSDKNGRKKLKFFALFVAILFLSITLFGCDEGMQMMKPAMQEKEPMIDDKPPVEESTMGGMKQEEEPSEEKPDDKQEMPEEKPPEAMQKPEPGEQSLDPNYKKAMELSGRLANIYQDVWFQHLEDPQPSFQIKVGKAFAEETGIEWFNSDLISLLQDRYLQHHPEDLAYMRTGFYPDVEEILITEFLYVVFTHPEEDDMSILVDEHFVEHIRERDLFDETQLQDGMILEHDRYEHLYIYEA